MANLHNERYDEIKSLLKKSRMLLEQDTQDNVAASVQSRIDQDMDYETAVSNREDGDDIEDGSAPVQKDKTQKYRISGGILALHGKDRSELDITSDEKIAFQETMDEFVNEVSDLADFNTLNVYPNNVEWSGKIIDESAKDKSTQALRDFNTKVATDSRVEPLLMPIRDGLFLLRVI